jgi:peroxiredoxin
VAGNPTTLAAALGSSPGVIVFYRGGWCPYCNIALHAYQSQLVPALAEQGIPLIAISPQTPDGSLSTREAKELTFTVLSDPGNRWIDVHADYTKRTEPDQVLHAIAQTIG